MHILCPLFPLLYAMQALSHQKGNTPLSSSIAFRAESNLLSHSPTTPIQTPDPHVAPTYDTKGKKRSIKTFPFSCTSLK